MEQKENNNLLVLSFGFLTVVLWALAFPFTKVALKSFTPEALGSLRYLFASGFLIIISFIKKIPLPRLKDIPLFFLSGFTGFALYIYAFNKGSVSISASATSILISTAPIITAILAVIFYKEKLSKLCGVVIGVEFLGIVIIALSDGVFSINIDIVWVIIAASTMGVYNILQRKLLRRYKPFEATTYSIFAGTLLLSIFLGDGLQQASSASTLQIFNVAFLGIFPGALGYLLWVTAISKAKKVTMVTNFMFTTPLLSTIFAFVIIGEIPSVLTIIGGGIIIFGSILFQKFSMN